MEMTVRLLASASLYQLLHKIDFSIRANSVFQSADGLKLELQVLTFLRYL